MSDDTFSSTVENFSQDVGARVYVEVFLAQTFDSDFPAQYYVKTCTVKDSLGNEFAVVKNGCTSDLTQTIRYSDQEKI